MKAIHRFPRNGHQTQIVTLVCAVSGLAFLTGELQANPGKVVRGESAAPVSVTTNAAGNLLVDFGKHVTGWIEVDVATPGDYTFIWGEMIDAKGSVQTNVFYTRRQGTLRCACTSDRFEGTGWTRVPYRTGNNGVFRPEAVGTFGTVMPFRWLEVVRAPFPITGTCVRQVPIHYPYDMTEETFTCDSPELVRVHDFCKHTIRATTYMGKFIDGDRERLPYEADSYITQLGTYAITSDDTLVRAMADYFATHTTWPTEWKQFFIRIVHDDWMHAGKTDLVRKHYDLMKDVKAWRTLRRADGLLVTPGEKMVDSPDGGRVCDIVDWGKCYRDGFVFTEVNAVVNALHYRNLRELAAMARAIGKDDDAAIFDAEAAQTFDAYQRVLFDPAAGRYRDGIGTDHATVQGNAMALACGIVPPERVKTVTDYVVSKGFTCSTYMAQFVLEALFAGGREDEAFRLMTSKEHRSWLGMMAKGATVTMEFWDLTLEEPGRVPDMNHAWSTAPLNMISRWVLGVTPMKPGFAEISVCPHPGPLKRLSGTVPTKRGPVKLEMTREADGWRVALDTPAPAAFAFAGHTRHLEPGRHTMDLRFPTAASAVTAETVSFSVDATAPGRPLPNTQSTLTLWALRKDSFKTVTRNPEYDVLAFAEYMEIMGATGGSDTRDCLRDPTDRTVLDDYDFSRLISGCRNIVRLGLKPYLKLGNVPNKFSTNNNPGAFAMNIRPPTDDAVYRRYMEACAKALLDAFGREELLRWRFAVLTEFENGQWFKDVSGDGTKTFEAYCRLYEATTAAFFKTISPDLAFGIHAMAVTEGLWDERRFIRFAGEHRLPLTFITASFYDHSPGHFTKGMNLPQTISHLRDAARAAGFTNIRYGVDEGRILFGSPRKDGGERSLAMRIVGDTMQAAYDARIVKQLFDSDVDYFASWGYFSGPDTLFEGLPSVSFHVARESAMFTGMRRLPVSSAGTAPPGVEVDAVAAVSADGNAMRVMAYAFTNTLETTGAVKMAITVKPPLTWKGRDIRTIRRVVDDDANWFDEWRTIRKERGIGDERFNWSPDDPATLHPICGLKSQQDREWFIREVEPSLRDRARLKPITVPVKPRPDGNVTLELELPVNAVVFFELEVGIQNGGVAAHVPSDTAGSQEREGPFMKGEGYVYLQR